MTVKLVDHGQAIRDLAADVVAEKSSARVKAEVRKNLAGIPKQSGIKEIARLLFPNGRTP
ncbi:hypothetical protein BDV19DRAFT_390909 [Aspergillus venezuelensis]